MTAILSKKYLSRIKLAATYLIIIMGMSIIFSYTIYSLSDRELTGQRFVAIPQTARVSFMDEFDRLREIRLEQSRGNLRQRLITYNLITLIFGGILSYILASRALLPIEEAMEAQNRFTGDASHEIRTPLTAMRSEIEVTLRDKNLTVEDAKETLASNLEEIAKLEALTSGLLQLAKQENLPITREETPGKELVKEAIDQVTPASKKKKISIVNKVEKDFTLYGEPNSLRQAIVILLDNAIKYSPEKSSVGISLKTSRNAQSIVIQDNGVGIDKQDLPHIFDRFYRSDKSRTKIKKATGYGLGLSIAKQIADAHGGNVIITSNGSGTSASLQLPKK